MGIPRLPWFARGKRCDRTLASCVVISGKIESHLGKKIEQHVRIGKVEEVLAQDCSTPNLSRHVGAMKKHRAKSMLLVGILALLAALLLALSGSISVSHLGFTIHKRIRLQRDNADMAGTHMHSNAGIASFPAIEWVHFSEIANESELILKQVTENGEYPCQNVMTATAYILGLPLSLREQRIRMVTGVVHDLLIMSVDASGDKRCSGGDFFETDLSGIYWKSRPPVRDRMDGSYEVKLQVDPRFAGLFVFKVVLLFANYHGLRALPIDGHNSWVRNQEIARLQIEFVLPDSSVPIPPQIPLERTASAPHPELNRCRGEDLLRKEWSGRWTRELYNESCQIEENGRFLCLSDTVQCEKPWCEGPIGLLESNGWVYSAHCSFKIFTEDEAWTCLDKKWLFSWGDSTNSDTFQNILSLILGLDIKLPIERRFDTVYFRQSRNSHGNRSTTSTTPRLGVIRRRPGLDRAAFQFRDGGRNSFNDYQSSRIPYQYRSMANVTGYQLQHNQHHLKNAPGQSLRVTHIFNGHAKPMHNYQGLAALANSEYQNFLRSYFTPSAAPDFMTMNSGLHDAIFPGSFKEYAESVSRANKFWSSVLGDVRPKAPMFIYRSTVSVGGTSRDKGFNPQKIDLYNRFFIEKLKRLNLSNFRIVDFFDLTFPWHWDNDSNDGPHYGRFPKKAAWVNGNLGHQYFVDMMMAQVLLNTMCST